MTGFSYEQAFSRNIGWVTEGEQAVLRGKSVAIAGMGGVGGIHLLTLARLGIGAFRIADFDRFDIVNFNRQAGATMGTIGRPKLDVMAEMALAINPELDIARFPDGVTPEAIDAFLDGADLFVDGFDFFALPIRMKVFARCAERGIPAVTAAPIGMGTGYMAFVPGGMTFEQYFRLDGHTENEQFLRFLMGVVPRALHRAYLVDPSRIDLANRRGPSTAAACQLCAGVVATMATKLLLHRGDVDPAPWHHHFDAYRNRYVRTRLSGGNAAPLQRLRLALARRAMQTVAPSAAPAPDSRTPGNRTPSPLDPILDAARWAPSGDNSQPWTFEPLDGDTVRIRLTSEAGLNPYDYRGGEPTLLSGGMLLESLRLAATRHGRTMTWTVEQDTDPVAVIARFPPAPDVQPDPLVALLAHRSVDRRRYSRRPLTGAERDALQTALGDALTVTWHETTSSRRRIAALGAAATDIRLRARETFEVHRRVIDWARGHSSSGMPSSAIGLDRGTLAVMRWAMRSWSRMRRLNLVTGTRMAALQLDVLPALASAAFFTLKPGPAGTGRPRVEQVLLQGMAVQRFWLTAARLNLGMQPGLAILIFAQYGADKAAFTTDPALLRKAGQLAHKFEAVLGIKPAQVTFIGRIGERRPDLPRTRSVRRPLAELLSDPAQAATASSTPPAKAPSAVM